MTVNEDRSTAPTSVAVTAVPGIADPAPLGLADFIDSYRSRGLGEWRILRHAFHNTLPTLLTVAGLQLGYLLGGVIFVETVFAWPGLGELVYNSISKRDLPVIQSGVMLSALAFVVINVIVDVLHGLIDPRTRAAAA